MQCNLSLVYEMATGDPRVQALSPEWFLKESEPTPQGSHPHLIGLPQGNGILVAKASR